LLLKFLFKGRNVYNCRFNFCFVFTIIRSDFGFVPTVKYKFVFHFIRNVTIQHNNIAFIHYRTLCCTCRILLNCKLPRDKQKQRILWVTFSKCYVIHSFCKWLGNSGWSTLHQGDKYGNVNIASLIIYNVDPRDQGQYRCRVGSQQSYMKVTVIGK
jgi:hypothetical protein